MSGYVLANVPGSTRMRSRPTSIFYVPAWMPMAES
jgi:hypothetical protein